MGVRSQLRRELMNLDANGLMTADDVREHLMKSKALVRQTGLSLVARFNAHHNNCLLYTSPSPRDRQKSRMPSSA